MHFRQLFDRQSCTYTYLLADADTGAAVLIDPVLELVDRDLKLVNELGLTLTHSLDTHVHADHITGAATLQQRTGCAIVLPSTADAQGADRYLEHGEVLRIGGVQLETRHTPGHTAGSATYVVHAAGIAFTGDTLLIRGCGRTDFQGGSAETLYDSVHTQIFSLPDTTVLYPGHCYRGLTCSTVGEEKRWNPRLGGGRSLTEFVGIMDALGLPHPAKIDVAVPANRRLGRPS